MRKTVLSGVLFAFLLVGAIASPYGMRGAADVINEEKAEEAKEQQYQQNLSAVEKNLVSTAQAFNDSRDFGVFYGDVAKLNGVLRSINGVEVRELVVVDPMHDYAEIGFLHAEDTPAAVKFELVVENPETALNVIDTMELPVAEIDISLPNTLTVIFLTGGEV